MGPQKPTGSGPTNEVTGFPVKKGAGFFLGTIQSMDLDAFLRQMDSLKTANERELSISRYPFQTLDNVKLIERLFQAANLPQPSAGRILDVGCGDGDLGFYMSAQGHTVDMLDFPETNQNQMQMVRKLAEQLPGAHTVTSVDLDRGLPDLERFYTLAITFGLLYHLKNPFLVLGDLAMISNFAVVSTRIVDSAVLTDDKASAYLVSDQQLGEDNTNFWLFNSAGFELLARRSGWSVLSSLRFGDMKKGDAGKHDARQALLLSSKYSVFPGVRITDGLNRVEYGSYRWTQDRFTVEVEPGHRILSIKYFLPEAWLSDHKLKAAINGSEVAISLMLGRAECEARITLPESTISIQIQVICENPFASDPRALGLVLKMDLNHPPLKCLN